MGCRWRGRSAWGQTTTPLPCSPRHWQVDIGPRVSPSLSCEASRSPRLSEEPTCAGVSVQESPALPVPLETPATIATTAPPTPWPAMHQGALSAHPGSSWSMAAAQWLALLGPESLLSLLGLPPRPLIRTFGRPWKAPPHPWQFPPLSPWLSMAEGKMTQCPRSVLFPGRSQEQGTGAPAGWLGPRAPGSKAWPRHLLL